MKLKQFVRQRSSNKSGVKVICPTLDKHWRVRQTNKLLYIILKGPSPNSLGGNQRDCEKSQPQNTSQLCCLTTIQNF